MSSSRLALYRLFETGNGLANRAIDCNNAQITMDPRWLLTNISKREVLSWAGRKLGAPPDVAAHAPATLALLAQLL